MPERTSYDAGTPSWIDLTSPDTDASKAFYGGVFGWTAEDQHDDQGNLIYVMFRKDGKDVAGMGPQQPEMAGMPPIWNTYVATDDAEQTAKAAEAAGGTIMMPVMQVMDAGKMAIFSDPAGAVICVWEAGQHAGARLVNEPGAWSWNELLTRDLDGVKGFYREVFGWEYDEMDMPTGPYTVVRGGESGLAGMMPMPAEIPEQVPNHWGVYFSVADAEATVAKITELGGQMVMDLMEVEGVGTMGAAHDPMGGSFSIMQMPSGD